jgi:hypothetical protein
LRGVRAGAVPIAGRSEERAEEDALSLEPRGAARLEDDGRHAGAARHGGRTRRKVVRHEPVPQDLDVAPERAATRGALDDEQRSSHGHL